MQAQRRNKTSEKRRSKIVAYSLSQDVIDEFNDKVGYNFRSKIVNGLISDFIKKKGSSVRQQTPKKQPGVEAALDT